jgi:hypothetical protein
MLTSPKPRIDWLAVIRQAADIVMGYDTGVTLRQLFYRLVVAGTLPNADGAYKTLSSRTAEARRQGRFPALIDRTRRIHRYQTFDGPEEARSWLRDIYRRDRTEGQDVSIYLGVEKAGIVEQLDAWFGELGLPILALGGYSSQSYVDAIRDDALAQNRPAVLIYAGDFDPSGEDIDRDFIERVGCFDEVVRVALTADQVERYELPEQMGKQSDSRARKFIARHGRLVQVELDALPPDLLRSLYDEAIATRWDESAFQASLAREREEAAALDEAS